jgi:ubiquinone/menaquinone biosynthesis C-methylase UbiE
MNFKDANLTKNYNILSSCEELYENDLADKIIKNVGKENAKLLDLAGGTGRFSEVFHNKINWDITVADYFDNMLEEAKLKGFKTILMNINNINSDDKFDIIVIKFSIHFVNNNKFFYSAISKILNPNGKIFIITRPKRTDFPYTEKLHTQWANSQPYPEEIVAFSETFFNKYIETLKFPISMKSNTWKNMMINKVYSHIQDDDVEEAKSYPDSDEIINFNDIIILIELTLI